MANPNPSTRGIPWQPGKSGNQSGLSAREHRIKHMVLGLGMKAGKRLEQLIDSEDESIALGAVKEVLARTTPTPKTQNNLTIVDLSGAHLEALRRLTSNRNTEHRQHQNPERHSDRSAHTRAAGHVPDVTDVDDNA